MKSETPRTDAVVREILSDLQSGTMEVVHAEFARELERELVTAKVHCADANKGARINSMINMSLTKKVLELEARIATILNDITFINDSLQSMAAEKRQ